RGIVRDLAAKDAAEPADVPAGATILDFYAYLPQHRYIYIPGRDTWPAASIDARLPKQRPPTGGKRIRPSLWLDRDRAVEQLAWAPGEPPIIPDRLIHDGGWVAQPGVHVFNLYRPPTLARGDATAAGPWLAHVRLIYPDAADHIIAWLAHRVQRPGEK